MPKRGDQTPINKPVPHDKRAISFSVRWVGGHTTITVGPDELAAYNADPDAFVAAHFGLRRGQCTEHIEVDGAMSCGATTKKGTLFSVMLGPVQMDVGSWLALHREQYCKSHGG
jgi:hypothetical protein